MKLAKSYLLQQIISAPNVSHGDCEKFQIICPECSEAVFKVERPNDDKVIHYFSHRRKDLAFAAECDLRVDSLSKSFVQRVNGESRGQNLTIFLQVLESEVARQCFDEKFPQQMKAARRSKAVTWLMRRLINGFQQHKGRGIARQYIDITLGAFAFETPFTLETTTTIVSDIWNFLLSQTGLGLFEFMFRAAIIGVPERLEQLIVASKTQEQTDAAREIIKAVPTIIAGLPEEASREVNRLADIPASRGKNAADYLLMQIAVEICVLLFSLDYLAILRARRGENGRVA